MPEGLPAPHDLPAPQVLSINGCTPRPCALPTLLSPQPKLLAPSIPTTCGPRHTLPLPGHLPPPLLGLFTLRPSCLSTLSSQVSYPRHSASTWELGMTTARWYARLVGAGGWGRVVVHACVAQHRWGQVDGA